MEWETQALRHNRTFSGTRKLGEKQLLEVNDVMARVKPSQVVQTIEVNNGWARV